MIFESPTPSVTTITFFKFSGYKKFWIITQMQFIKIALIKEADIDFFRVMGSGGGNGFSLTPDFSVYAFLICWKSQDCAREFFQNHKLYKKVFSRCSESWTIYLKPIKSHGKWDGLNPFKEISKKVITAPIAVITRATIFPSKVLGFWKKVPKVSNGLKDREGLIFSKGIGEVPILRQATFSLWENEDKMKAYAYKSGHHQKIIAMTRKRKWYKEELFAQFHPFYTTGTWGGVDPLEKYLIKLIKTD
jgi:hypothetical protein